MPNVYILIPYQNAITHASMCAWLDKTLSNIRHTHMRGQGINTRRAGLAHLQPEATSYSMPGPELTYTDQGHSPTREQQQGP